MNPPCSAPTTTLAPGTLRNAAAGRCLLLWAAATVALLSIWVLRQRQPPFWDEIPYLGQARVLVGSDSLVEWLRANDAGPTGPLHPLMHFVLSGGSGTLPVPWVRLPNLLLLVSIIGMTAGGLRLMQARPQAALALMAVPTTWVVSGMALTEIPSIAGLMLAMVSALRLGLAPPHERPSVPQLSMLATGLAIAALGRQTSLAFIPTLLLLAVRGRRDALPVAGALAIGAVPIFVVFAIWGGIVPPRLAFVGGGLRPMHGAFALCTTGEVALLLAPAFFRAHWRVALTAGALAATASLLTYPLPIGALTSVQQMLGNPAWVRFAALALPWAAVFVAAAFAGALAEAIWREPSRGKIAFALAIAANAGACAMISHQYSSRYIAATLPLLVLLLARWMDFGWWALARYATGAAIGFASLVSYYRVH